MYTKIGEEKDDKIVKLWQKDADGILIFVSPCVAYTGTPTNCEYFQTGLFSTAVATFLTVSIQDLKPSPQYVSEFYLERIYNRLGSADPSNAPVLDTATIPTFSPPRYAVWVNSLWFLSFAISLTYATLAMMLQQWGRRYIRVTQRRRSSPHKRARIRAFFSGAIDGLHVLWVIETVRAMTHLSMFLFFAGLLIYLFNICHAAFAAVVWWVALSTAVYVSFTLLPIFRPNSPYYAPLSPTLRLLYACTSFAVFQVLSSQAFSFLGSKTVTRFRGLRDYYRRRLLEDIAEESVTQQSSAIDVQVLDSTLHDLSEDGAWEKFFEAVPGFLSSKLVYGIKLSEEFRETFGQALGGFLDRTFSFNSVTESFRSNRLVICLNAAHAVRGVNGISQIFTDIFSGRWPELLQSVEIGHSLRRWDSCSNEQVTWDVRRTVAQIVVGVRERDDRWISLAMAEYGIPGHVLREYIGHGDSVLLSILIHMTREAFHTRSWTPWILSSLAEFSIRDTFPELQHAFCTLWNDIVLEAWNEEGPENISVRILREIRHACIALHQDTGAVLMTFSASTHHFDPDVGEPRSYRVCKIAGHRQRLTIPTGTPFAGSSAVPSLMLDQISASPHPSLIESNRTFNGSTVPQSAEEANIIVVSPPGTDYTPHPSGTQESIPPPPAVNSTPIAQTASIIGPSVPESIGTVVSRDPDLLVPDEAPHHPRQQPALPATEIAAVATIVRPDDPARQLQISEMGDISHAPAETSLTPAHPDMGPPPILFSTPPSSFIPDPGDNSDMLQPITLATATHSQEHNEQQDATMPCASLNINEIPPADDPVPWSIPTALPTIVVSDSLSSRVLHPVYSCDMTTEWPSPSLQSTPIQPDHILGTPGPVLPLSTLTTSVSEVTSVSFAQFSSNIGAPGPHDDADDPNLLISMTALPRSIQTAIPAHEVVSNTLPLDGVQRDPDK